MRNFRQRQPNWTMYLRPRSKNGRIGDRQKTRRFDSCGPAAGGRSDFSSAMKNQRPAQAMRAGPPAGSWTEEIRGPRPPATSGTPSPALRTSPSSFIAVTALSARREARPGPAPQDLNVATVITNALRFQPLSRIATHSGSVTRLPGCRRDGANL